MRLCQKCQEAFVNAKDSEVKCPYSEDAIIGGWWR